MNLNYVATSRLKAEPFISAGKQFNTLMIVSVNADKAGTVETVTKGATPDEYSEDLKKAISFIFSQELAPFFIKVGFVAEVTPAELDKLKAVDYWTLTGFLPDEPLASNVADLAVWFAENEKIATFTTAFSDLTDAVGSVVGENYHAEISNTNSDFVFSSYGYYPADESAPMGKFVGLAILGAMATVDFDQPNSYYSIPSFINDIKGINAFSLTDNDRLALTGYTINAGYDTSITPTNFWGDYEGVNKGYLYTGLMASYKGINDTHFLLWLNRRIQEAMANLIKSERVLTYSDADLAKVALQVKLALQKGVRAGGLLKGSINVEDIETLKERITNGLKNNHILKVVQSEMKCSGWFSHIASETQCVQQFSN